MSRIICIIGNKGGTGKTTLSHMLCQGLGLLGQRSACVLTDSSREPLSPDGRRYVTADARTPEALHKVVGKLRTMQGWIGVIDGGGNRAEVDRTLDSLCDIVLLPFRDSHEDLRTVLHDLEAFPHAYALPSQWPTNAWQRTPPTATWPSCWAATGTASCTRLPACRPPSCCCKKTSPTASRPHSATPAGPWPGR
jgi:chromosome partitioning protein